MKEVQKWRRVDRLFQQWYEGSAGWPDWPAQKKALSRIVEQEFNIRVDWKRCWKQFDVVLEAAEYMGRPKNKWSEQFSKLKILIKNNRVK